MSEPRTTSTSKPQYRPPSVKLMQEEDVLRIFQSTSAGVGWWVPGVGGSG
jgi:hypothetical protein